jgi:hypothetical protein
MGDRLIHESLLDEGMVNGEPTPLVAGSALEGAQAEITARFEGVDDPWRSVGRIRVTREALCMQPAFQAEGRGFGSRRERQLWFGRNGAARRR